MSVTPQEASGASRVLLRTGSMSAIVWAFSYFYLYFAPTEMLPFSWVWPLVIGGGLFAWVVGVSIRLAPEAIGILILVLAVGLAVTLSIVLNNGALRDRWETELLRPFSLGVVFFFGYVVSWEVGRERLTVLAMRLSAVVLCGLAFIAILQLFSPGLFSGIWASDKTRGLHDMVRVTGSLSNPNWFALFVIIAALPILTGMRSISKWIWLLLSAFLVLLSGSRTMIAVFMAVVAFMVVIDQGRPCFRTVATSVVLAASFLSIFWLILFFFGDTLRYLAQLRSAIGAGSLFAVNAFAVRQEMWIEGLTSWDLSSVNNFLFGVGPIPDIRTLDSDYLTASITYGFFGALAHLGLYVYLFRVSWLARDTILGRWLLGAILCLFLFGFMSETLTGWRGAIVIMFLAGSVLGALSQGRSFETSPGKFPTSLAAVSRH